MRAFDVFVLSSLWEGLSRVIPEAMASGLPVVASAVDGASDAIQDRVSGVLVPPASPDALAEQLIEILTNPFLAKKLSENARGRAGEFDLTTMIRQLEALYDELATRALGPDTPPAAPP
jgi:glycosyltransferase involved in cell wall biosynthesis